MRLGHIRLPAVSALAAAALTLAVAAQLASCGRSEPSAPQLSYRDRAEIAQRMDGRIAAATNGFGLELTQRLAEKRPGNNTVVSPASVVQALAMTWNGAAGKTKQAMTAALRLDGLAADEVNRSERALMELLQQSSPGVQTSIANSLWLQTGWPFRQSYLDAVKDSYGAALNERQLTKPSVRKEINSWVSNQTHGRIPSIIDEPISEVNKLLLVNALYMKAAWQTPFEKSATQDGDFRLEDGTVLRVPMMHQRGMFRYDEEESYQAVQLPYGEGQLAMTIVLPKPEADRKALEAKLFTDPAWWVQPFQSRRGDLALPRFHAETSLKLQDTLKAMGMAPAFDPAAADFSAMADTSRQPLYIGSVLHKTYLDVTEQGTEAAAATVVAAVGSSAPPNGDRFQMTVDRPFWFAIVDEQSRIVLFAGLIERPQDARRPE